MAKVYVIGIGYRPLDERARQLISRARVILASRRLYEVFSRYREFQAVKARIIVHERFTEMMDYLKEAIGQGEDVVLLGSGDPLFFGIGRRLLREYGPERVEILPDLSSMQVAMARVGISWDDAFFVSLHGGPLEGQRRQLPYGLDALPAIIQRHKKVVILTDPEYNPSRIARAIMGRLAFQVEYYVCQRMGYPDERVEKVEIEEAAERDFLEPNLVVILRSDDVAQEVIFGLEESSILHSQGMITKDEVRAISLHKLRIPPEGVLWDIGAGSGSVGMEASRLSPALKVYCIERSSEAVDLIRRNRDLFGAYNLQVIEGETPEALQGLPQPQRVFIGGTGGRMKDILRAVSDAMPKGVVVMNIVRIEALTEAMSYLRQEGFGVDLTGVVISKGKPLGGLTHLQALNPVFVLRGSR